MTYFGVYVCSLVALKGAVLHSSVGLSRVCCDGRKITGVWHGNTGFCMVLKPMVPLSVLPQLMEDSGGFSNRVSKKDLNLSTYTYSITVIMQDAVRAFGVGQIFLVVDAIFTF